MNKEIYIFDKKNYANWPRIANKLTNKLNSFWLKKNNNSFWVNISLGNQPKTNTQTKGFYKLCDILVNYFRELTGEYWDKNLIKEFIKKRVNYIKIYQGIEVTKSLKEATKEDMIILIEEAQKLGAELGCENCFLESYEQQEFLKFFSRRKKIDNFTN
ncbi:MAG: hypothetical protein ULS35scaffold63_57 [Phage 33_17]|nr:MAG: hypothetical protein ULS35scaffold63_57 [Phage 33_17]